MRHILLIFLILTSVLSTSSPFLDWLQNFNKTFTLTPAERSVWNKNMDFIAGHNSASSSSFKVGLNQFAHLTQDQYRAQLWSNGLNLSKSPPTRWSPFVVPSSWDWRAKNMVAPVQDSGSCSDEWASVATNQVSSCCAIQGKKPYVQGDVGQVQSCSGGDCCSPGVLSDAFAEMQKFGISNSTSGYGKCLHDETQVFCKLVSVSSIPRGDEDAMKIAVFLQGPVTVGIDASHMSFQFYSSGIYYEPACSPTNINHLLLVIGYGSIGKNDFWIAQNSWGKTWGMSGTILLARNKRNNCGVASAAYSASTKVVH